MSVYIKGMEMPTRCFACPLCDTDCCGISKGSYVEYRDVDVDVAMNGRPDWCPLVEVPDHGRLIDADALRASIKESIGECHKWADEVSEGEMYARVSQALGTFVECSLRIKAAPTIIPASGGKVNE